jgi:hypothetical protein
MKIRLLALLLALSSGCSDASDTSGPTVLGSPVDDASVVTLETALQKAPPAEVTLRGEVQQVCTSAGCWFTLRERTGDSSRDLRVDLLPAADFRLDQSAVGKTVVVRGRLAGDPDRELHALGLRLL